MTPAAAEAALFVLKQGWACLFGGLLLIAIVATKLVWSADWPVHRYDALFAASVALRARTRIRFRIDRHDLWMPLPAAALLSSLALYPQALPGGQIANNPRQ